MPRVQSLLIANRGEIAVRIARSAVGLGVRPVMVYTDVDRGARHLRASDRAVRVPSYLDPEALTTAAWRAGCDAVHPGYGFLSENAAFATAVQEAGLTWIGPPPAAIAAMGSKTEARRRVSAHGVPVVPGTLGERLDTVSLIAAAEDIGYPVIVKAAAGGGGKGMRVVHHPAALPDAIEEARRLALASFGDDQVFLERYLGRARHVEVQILADQHGQVFHLWERECSLQRRHQKVIEEAPSPAFRGPEGEARRLALCADAVRAAASVGYQSAGTIELLLDADGRHYFLEMNTRIQVEHPVTEAITGLDLVAWQIRVAEGEALPETLRAPPRNGWAIEARLYAEDPDQGWMPCAGTLHAWSAPEGREGVRIDAGVGAGDAVSIHYDPMLAKIIAHGEDRERARQRLRSALMDTVVLGVTCSRAWLLRALDHPQFVAGDLHTGFLDEHRDTLVAGEDRLGDEVALCAAVVLGWLRRRAARKGARGGEIPGGFRTNPLRPQRQDWRLDGVVVSVSYRERGDHTLEINGAEVRVLDAGAPLVLEIDGLVHSLHTAVAGDRTWVHSAHKTRVLEAVPDLPEPQVRGVQGGRVAVAPMPGKVVAVRVAPGDVVEPGQVLLVLEAMKMEQAVRAGVAGVVARVRVAPGAQVDQGQVLVEVGEDA